jgi:hypothetical protein
MVARLAASDVEILMRGKAVDAVAEQLQPHLTPDAVRAGDGGERNPTLAAPVHD